MKNYIYLFWLILLFLSCGEERKASLENSSIIKDDLGFDYNIESIPEKVVTLAPNLTEIIYELGLEDKLVGNTTYCNFPEESNKIEKVGDLLSIDHEKMLALAPDLVFITVEGNTKDTFDKLKSLGLKLFISDPRTYNGIKKTFRDFAKIFKVDTLAESKIKRWDEAVDSIKNISQTHPQFSTLFLVSVQPIMAAGKSTFINEFLKFCSLKNIVADQALNYPFLSREEVLKRNPDIILHTQHNYADNVLVTELYSEWTSLNAVKNERVYYLDPDLYFRPGPRFITALKQLNTLISK